MKRISILLLSIFFVACASADSGDAQQRRGREFSNDAARPARADDTTTSTFMPPFNWWHNDNVANAISLTADQVRSLDAALGGDAAAVARLETDLRNVSQDFRKALETDPVVADDINAAARRVRDARNALFDLQVQLLVAERRIVTAPQWTDLEQLMQRTRRGGEGERNRRGNRGGYPGGYPGGMPGGGPPNPWGW